MMHLQRTLHVLEEFALMIFEAEEKERHRLLGSARNLVAELTAENVLYHQSRADIKDHLHDLQYHLRHVAGLAADGLERRLHLQQTRETLARLAACFGLETETP